MSRARSGDNIVIVKVDKGKLSFVLLFLRTDDDVDFARSYRDDVGESARALFIVDESGTIAWSHLSPVAVNPGADGVLDALDQMPTPEQKNADAQSSRQSA